MELCNQCCSSVHSSILHGKSWIVWHHLEIFPPNLPCSQAPSTSTIWTKNPIALTLVWWMDACLDGRSKTCVWERLYVVVCVCVCATVCVCVWGGGAGRGGGSACLYAQMYRKDPVAREPMWEELLCLVPCLHGALLLYDSTGGPLATSSMFSHGCGLCRHVHFVCVPANKCVVYWVSGMESNTMLCCRNMLGWWTCTCLTLFVYY